MSTFGSFEIGRRAIHAQQKGTQVTGQNIANANTEGYTRQMVHMKALVPAAAPGVITPPGYGVEVSDISRVKSEFYDDQIRKGLTAQKYWERMKETTEAIESILQEPGESGINATLSEFFDAWQELSVNPENHAVRIGLREQAETLTGLVRDTYERLDEFQGDIRKELEAKVTDINAIAAEVADLNEKIVYLQGMSKKSNEMLDERDLRLQELSELIDVRVIEKENGSVEVMAGGRTLLHDDRYFPVEVKENEENGNLYLETENGAQLTPSRGEGDVGGLLESYNETFPEYKRELDELVFHLVQEVNNQHSMGYGLDNSTGMNFFQPWIPEGVTEGIMPGQPYVEVDDNDMGIEYFSPYHLMEGEYEFSIGGVGETTAASAEVTASTISDLDENFVSVKANNNGELNSSLLFEVVQKDEEYVYLQYKYHHTDKNGELHSGEGHIKLEADEEGNIIESQEFAFGSGENKLSLGFNNNNDSDIEDFVVGERFVVNVSAEANDGDKNVSLSENNGNNKEYFSYNFDDSALENNGANFRFFQLDTGSGEYRDVLLKARAEEENGDFGLSGGSATFSFDPGDDVYQPEGLDDYIDGAARHFQLNPQIRENLDAIAASSQSFREGDGSNSLNVAKLREKKVMGDDENATFQDHFRGVIADLGVRGREAFRMSESMRSVTDKMKEEHDSISSVSLDDEMLNMVQFQHAYNAAARFMTVFDQMLGVLINEMGR